jgi:hypothetical protein
MFDEKTRGQKSHETVSLKYLEILLSIGRFKGTLWNRHKHVSSSSPAYIVRFPLGKETKAVSHFQTLQFNIWNLGEMKGRKLDEMDRVGERETEIERENKVTG